MAPHGRGARHLGRGVLFSMFYLTLPTHTHAHKQRHHVSRLQKTIHVYCLFILLFLASVSPQFLQWPRHTSPRKNTSAKIGNCVYMYIYIYMCIYIYTYIHIYVWEKQIILLHTTFSICSRKIARKHEDTPCKLQLVHSCHIQTSVT